MASADNLLVGRYDSLAALFSALDAHKLARACTWGCVRIHPTLFWGKRLPDHLAVRKRLEASGLRLLITAAIELDAVELRRYAAANDSAAGARPPAERLPHR